MQASAASVGQPSGGGVSTSRLQSGRPHWLSGKNASVGSRWSAGGYVTDCRNSKATSVRSAGSAPPFLGIPPHPLAPSSLGPLTLQPASAVWDPEWGASCPYPPLTRCSHQGADRMKCLRMFPRLSTQPWMTIQCASLPMARQAVARPSPWRVGDALGETPRWRG